MLNIVCGSSVIYLGAWGVSALGFVDAIPWYIHKDDLLRYRRFIVHQISNSSSLKKKTNATFHQTIIFKNNHQIDLTNRNSVCIMNHRWRKHLILNRF